jgi:peroxiredoxin
MPGMARRNCPERKGGSSIARLYGKPVFRATPHAANQPAEDVPEKEKAMTIKVGDKIPDTTFMQATANGPEPVESADFFKGRKVALFSVPGAFTPTCSAKHLPGFIDNASQLKAKGVDEIACTAVNDAFVMGAWGKSANADGKVTMLADGSGNFAKAVGLEMDGTKFGLGMRGQRFSMIVDDGVVSELNVEAPGEFKVSTAEHMLGQL